MSKDKLTLLIEALSSAGYDLSKFNDLYVDESRPYGNIEIFISFTSNIKDFLSKERIIKLVEALYAAGYGIVKYELLDRSGVQNLVLQTF